MAKSLNDYFDKIYCIHVDGYEDRYNNIMELAKEMNCDIEFFEASTPKTIDIPELKQISPTQYACAHSHLNLWHKIMTEDKPHRPLILEDDAKINENVDVLDILERYHERVLNEHIDITLLGTNYVSARTQPIDDHIQKLTFGLCLHAYSPTLCVLNWIWDGIVNLGSFYNNPQRAIDDYVGIAISRKNCRVFRPPLMYQKDGYSIINGVYDDYRGELIR